MTVRILLDAQHSPYKQEISGWRFSDKAPFVMRDFANHDPAKDYLFKCRECGSNEFNSNCGALVECDSCSTEYVVVWAN